MANIQKVGAAVVGILLGGTAIAGALVGQNTNANSLEPKAVTALQNAGISGVDVSFKGREAYLTGQGMTDAQLQQAKQVVESVYGVRWARITGNNTSAVPVTPAPTSLPPTPTAPPTTTTAPTTAPAVQPAVNIATGANGVTLSGTVATQAEADALAAQAERVFGSPVINQLKVDPSVDDPAWVNGMITALQGSPAITGGSLTAGGTGVSIGGVVAKDADAAALQASLAAFQAGAGGVPVTNTVTVAAPSSSSLTPDQIAQINATVVNFANGTYSLSDTAMKNLDTVIPLLANSTAKVEIDGYVSTPHPAGREVTDSTRRAQAVADYLVAHGIDASRLTVVGRGTDNPVASNDTAEGQAANRRATLTVS